MNTIGERLTALRARSGLTLDQVAEAASYRGRSSVQKYFSSDYNPPFLDRLVAGRLARALVGKGNPPIAESELLALAGDIPKLPEYNFKTLPRVERRVPVYLTFFVKISPVLKNQPPIPVFYTELDNPVEYVWQPPAINERHAVYGMRFQRGALTPRYRPGEYVFLDPDTDPRYGDDVCIYFETEQSDEAIIQDNFVSVMVIFGTLERQTLEHLFLRTIEGDAPIKVAMSSVEKMHRVITLTDALRSSTPGVD